MPGQQSWTVDYFYTITLKPSCYDNIAEHQYDITWKPVYDLIKSLPCKLTMVAEVTRNMNIHYHGIVSFLVLPGIKSYIKAFKDKFRLAKHIGYTNITQIENHQQVKDYITKDLHQTKELIGRPPVISNEQNYIDLPTLTNLIQQI